jgi:hypothetical protein
MAGGVMHNNEADKPTREKADINSIRQARMDAVRYAGDIGSRIQRSVKTGVDKLQKLDAR